MKYLTIFLSLFLCLSIQAEVRLSAIFTDGMVLQQQKNVAIWGWATEGATVSVITSWNHKEYTAQASEKGIWRIFMETEKAGGPYNIQISEGNNVTLRDVLIGEVWLCSGQSNMEMPLKGYPGQPILGSTDAILESSDEGLRFYNVPRNPVLKPADDSKPSAWKKANSDDVANFSATAYYFGQRLRNILKVPVGLIHSSYAGSNIEAWMDAAWLSDINELQIPLQDVGLKDKNRQPTMFI